MKHRSLRMLCAPPPVGVPARGWVGGRTLLVAVRRDAAGRELLAWALAKAAAAGDRVVAVHVTAPDGSGTDEMRGGAAADLLASVLAAYDGFCSLNQVLLGFTPRWATAAQDTLLLPRLFGMVRAMLAHCSSLLRQINLELRVCHGSSVKKALVKEAISYGAAQLILGVMKNSPLGYATISNCGLSIDQTRLLQWSDIVLVLIL
jgi:hypothetical protein